MKKKENFGHPGRKSTANPSLSLDEHISGQTQKIFIARSKLTQFADTHSLSETLQATLDEVESLTDSTIGFYHFLETDQQTLTLQAWSTRTSNEFCTAEGKGRHYNIADAGVWVDCVRQRRPVIHNNYALLPHRKGMPEGHATVVRELVVPVFRADRIVAILGVGNKQSDYDESDVELVTLFADLAWDIAQRKLSEDSIRQSQQAYQTLVGSIDGIVWEADARTFQFSFVSEQAERLLGYPIDRWISEPTFWKDHIHEDDRAATVTYCIAATNEKRNHTFEYRMIAANGRIVWLRDIVSVIVKNDIPVKLRGIMVDITDHKHTEEKLKESEERLRLTLEATQIGIWDWDIKNDQWYASPTYYSMLGYEPKPGLGDRKEWLERLHPDDRQSVSEKIQNVLTGNFNDYCYEARMLHADLSYRWQYVLGFVVERDKNGKASRLLGTRMDINDRKTAEEEIQRSEKKFRAVWEGSIEAMRLADTSGTTIMVNDAFCVLVGKKREELEGRNVAEIHHPDLRESVLQSYRRRCEERTADRHYEGIIHLWDERDIFVEGGHTFLDIPDQPTLLLSVFRNVSKRKAAEHALQHYTERLEKAEEHAGLGSWEYTPHSNHLLWWSKSLYHMLHFEPSGESPDFENFIEHVHPDDQPIVRNTQDKMFQGISIPSHEFRTNPKYGPVRILSAAFYVDPAIAGRPVKYHGTILDVTEMREASRQILKLNRIYAVLSNINQAIVRIHDRQMLFNEICKIAIEDGKFTLAWIGMVDETTKDVVIVASSGADEKFLQSLKINTANETQSTGPTGRAIKTGAYALSMDIEHDELMRPWRHAILALGCRSSGSFPFNVSGKIAGTLTLYSHEANFFDADEVKLLDELASDISFALEFIQQEAQRKKAEAFLVRSEAFFRAVWDHSASGMRITDKNGTVISVNDAYCRIVEKSKNEIEGFLLSDVYAEQDRSRIVTKHRENFLAKKVPAYFEKCLTLWNGKIVWLDVSNSFIDSKNQPVLLLSVFTDGTNKKLAEDSKKNLEKQLQQSQKMESLGTLASGIAHDFNNILGIMIAHASMLSKMNATPDIIQKSSEAITKAGMRGAGLVKQMLTFARKTDVKFTTVSLNEIVTDVSKLLNETFPKTIVVLLHLENKLPAISADATQVHQVLLNLCVNARDAMQNNGTLTVITRVQSGALLRSHNPKAGDDEYIELTVQDTGTGMSEETKRRMFEPFFTTKELGKGTGLGLSLVFGIMETHGGFLEVESELGKGTTFHCYFPIRKTMENSVDHYNQKEELIEGGGETILLVEDEDLLVNLVKQILEGKGYSVLVARDGEEGLMMYEKNRHRIDLIVSDMGLPKFGGYELFQKIKAMDPKVRLIFASGYIEPGTKEKILNEGVKQFIQKPYELNEMLRAVRNALR